MLLGKVKTITLKWWVNLIKGVSQGTVEFDYWNSGWLPRRKIDRIEVYFEGDRVLSGAVLDCFMSTPHEVYRQYKNNPYSIGLDYATNSLQDFENLLKIPFGNTPNKIGNIIFNVDFVSKKTLDAILSNKSENFNIEIKALESKTEDIKKLQRRIIYEEI